MAELFPCVATSSRGEGDAGDRTRRCQAGATLPIGKCSGLGISA